MPRSEDQATCTTCGDSLLTFDTTLIYLRIAPPRGNGNARAVHLRVCADCRLTITEAIAGQNPAWIPLPGLSAM